MTNVNVTQFATELQQLDAALAKLGGAAEEQLERALEALQRRDRSLAEAVIDADKSLDSMEADIERQVATIFVRRQPMAADLRVTLSSIKIASAIERIGDLAKNTARRSMTLTENAPLKHIEAIVRFGRLALTQFSEAFEAYVQRDTQKALEVWKSDEQLDHLHTGLLRELISVMEENPSQVGLYSQLTFISKNMERIGDHATFIAETTHYIVTGLPFAQERPKGPPDGAVEQAL